MIYKSTKYFKEIGPCAYRNWRSDTDCYLLHGYCRSFKFVFGCKNLDRQGFVVDFGGLKDVKNQLQAWFDHTVILQSDDPILPVMEQLEAEGHCNLQTFPLISSEHIEAEKNSAIYYPQDNPDRLDFETLVELNKEILSGGLH